MKKIKVGVFGAGRGADIAKNFMLLKDCEVVALCDFSRTRLEKGIKKLGKDIATYESFDEFINHDMDAVILANYFHEHAPFAIRCFEKGLHVFSECISNGTMAEGVELIRAHEKYPNSIYFLAENYPQMLFNREIKKVYDNGSLGKFMYAEAEYNHPWNTSLSDEEAVNFANTYIYSREHWRNFLPISYYITHSLGPVMHASGATPKTVTAFPIYAPIEGDHPSISYVGDSAAIITTQNDDGSIFRVTGSAKFGAHHISTRLCGTKGQIENVRGMENQVMLRYNAWDIPEGLEENNLYTPEWNDADEELIKASGHGGGDFVTARMFLECIRENRQPEHPFDIHSAVTMSSTAILSYRSILDGGKPYQIPDFKTEEARKEYENDRQTPFYGSDGSKPNIVCCSNPDYKPTDEQIEKFMSMIKE